MALPLGHAHSLGSPRNLSMRERRMVRAVVVLAAALAGALVIALLSSSHASGHGCIHATIPGAVGAQEINQCGAEARSTCRTISQPGSYTPNSARVLSAECRKAGLAVG